MLAAAGMASLLWAQAMLQADVSVDARLSPAPPWSPRDSVELRIDITNHGAHADSVAVDFDGILRSDGLVGELAPRDAHCPLRGDRDANPNPQRFFLLGRSASVPGASTVTCRFAVIAHPFANGQRIGRISIYPSFRDDLTNNSVELLFAYGVAARAVPALNTWGISAALLCFAIGWLRQALRRDRHNDIGR